MSSLLLMWTAERGSQLKRLLIIIFLPYIYLHYDLLCVMSEAQRYHQILNSLLFVSHRNENLYVGYWKLDFTASFPFLTRFHSRGLLQ